MYTNKQRAELANLCYMTIEKECSKPVNEINSSLVDACVDLANKLLGIEHLSEEEISLAKKKIEFMSVRQCRNKRRVRIIAAVLAILVALVTTACALSDWLLGIFGVKTLYTVQPGESVKVEHYDLEVPDGILYFDSVEKLADHIDESIYLPTDLPYGFVLNSIVLYKNESKEVEIMWSKDGQQVWLGVNLHPMYFQEGQFEEYEYDYYSKDNHPFDIVEVDSSWQAMAWIDNHEYIISADDRETLCIVIDQLTRVE